MINPTTQNITPDLLANQVTTLRSLESFSGSATISQIQGYVQGRLHEMHINASVGTVTPNNSDVPEELIPYAEILEAWIANHMLQLKVFLDNPAAPFTIKYGNSFSYQPVDNTITLCLKSFRDAIENKSINSDRSPMTLDQIMFALFHEIAHLKDYLEGDLAGRRNLLEQFKYFSKKKIHTSSNQVIAGKGNFYALLYNIFDDIIVNYRVLSSSAFPNEETRREIAAIYKDNFFPLYRNDAQQSSTSETEQKILVKAEEYEHGFDFREICDPKGLTGQFLSILIKSQMGVMPKEPFTATSSETRPKFQAHPTLVKLFSAPLIDSYRDLLSQVVAKIASLPPEEKITMANFLTNKISIPHLVYLNGKIQVKEERTYYNLLAESPEVLMQGDQSIVNSAWFEYQKFLKQAGLGSGKQLTIQELFAEFKKIDLSKKSDYTSFLQINANERAHLLRKILEPIVTMLSVLDGEFDLSGLENVEHNNGGDPSPEPSPDPGDQPGNNPEEKEEEDPESPGLWRPGTDVKNIDTSSKNYSKNGIIKVTKVDSQNKAIEVEVHYYEQGGINDVIVGNKNVVFTGEKETITRPVYEKLARIQQKSQPSSPTTSQQSKVKNISEEQADDTQSSPKEEIPQDIKDVFGDIIDQLKESVAEEEAQNNLKALEESQGSIEYQNKTAHLTDNEKIIEKIKQSGLNIPESLLTQLISDYDQVSEKMRPMIEKMAQSWIEVVKNISESIQISKEKYFSKGKIDYHKLQQNWEEIQHGQDWESRLIHSQWLEKLKVDLNPKMIRLTLLLDNSGSMSKCKKSVLMASLLLVNSLRSLREIFRAEMKQVLGQDYSSELDLICDIRICSWGSNTRELQAFNYPDLSFLEGQERPAPLDPQNEKIALIKAFAQMTYDEDTDDSTMWDFILQQYQNSQIQQLIAENKVTDVIIQVTDGYIENPPPVNKINQIKSGGTAICGFAIGGEEASTSLKNRHDVVQIADTEDQIVSGFQELLVSIISHKVQDTFIESLKE